MILMDIILIIIFLLGFFQLANWLVLLPKKIIEWFYDNVIPPKK